VRYLSAEDVARINELILSAEPIVDFDLLEGSVLRPQTTVAGHDAYPDIHAKAAAIFHSLIRNHPFIDGNKRTAVTATIVFYGLNGWWINTDDGDVVALAIDVAEGQIGVDQIAKRLSGWAERRPIDSD
jgi:death-on-curing protein